MPEQTQQTRTPPPAPQAPPWEPSTRRPRLRDWSPRDVGRVAAIVVAAVVFLVPALLLLSKRGEETAVAQQQAEQYTPPPITASVTRTGPVIAVVSDESAVRAASGVAADQRWPQLVSESLDSEVGVSAVADGGYLTEGTDGLTFGDLAGATPSGTDVVLLIGGANDASASAAAVERAVVEAVQVVATRAPDATVAVVGPVVQDGMSSDESAAVRGGLASGARIANVRWVDPIAARWVPASRADASRLTAEDQERIASKIESLVDRITS